MGTIRTTLAKATVLAKAKRAFTLVEILIVVVILGILASIVVPQYAGATQDVKQGVTLDQLGKIRRAIEVYRIRTGSFPTVTAGDGTWAELLIPQLGPYIKEPPINHWVGDNGKLITIGPSADAVYDGSYGWIYNSATGEVWAAGFDLNDEALTPP